MTPAYPSRPKFFAHGFTRLLGKVCIGAEIGPEACWLLSFIAHTEDAAGYRRPVTFYNEDLATRLGMSISSMRRARDRATAAGWLVCIPGAKRKPPQYFVAIPKWAQNHDDGAGDEAASELVHVHIPRQIDAESDTVSGRKAAGKRQESGAEPARKRQGSEQPSSLTQDNLTQDNLIPATAGATKRKPNPLFDAIAELSGLDPATAGGQIGKTAAALAKAEPPYTPADVEEFGRRFHELCGYAARDGRQRPTVGEIEKYVGLLRAKPPPKQLVPHGRYPQSRGQAELDFAARMAADAFGGSQ